MNRIHLLTVSALLLSANLAQAQAPPTLAQAQAAVDGWYRQYLGRAPDPTAAVWVLDLVNGKSAGDVLSDIIGSREFFTRAGGTNAGFVTLLYQDALGRAPMPNELLFWTNLLNRKSRKAVSLLFLVSQGNIAAVPLNQIPGRHRHHDRHDRDHRR